MTGEEKRDALGQRIDTIEEAYEFMLAYAGQGVDSDEGVGGAGPGVRGFLERADEALDGLRAAAAAALEERGGSPADRYAPFLDVLEEDASKARAALGVILAQPAISSQMVDNLNASIHMRALLTDLFLLDEAVPVEQGE